MANINLLPWREERRTIKRQETLVMFLAVALLGCLMVFFSYLTTASWIENQKTRNAFLEDEIAALDLEIKDINRLKEEKARLLARIDAIQFLQINRPEVVRLFAQIVDVTPEGLFFMEIARKDHKLNFEGHTESNTRVSKLMRNIDSASHVANPKLSMIKAVDEENKSFDSLFMLNANQLVMVPGMEFPQQIEIKQ